MRRPTCLRPSSSAAIPPDCCFPGGRNNRMSVRARLLRHKCDPLRHPRVTSTGSERHAAPPRHLSAHPCVCRDAPCTMTRKPSSSLWCCWRSGNRKLGPLRPSRSCSAGHCRFEMDTLTARPLTRSFPAVGSPGHSHIIGRNQLSDATPGVTAPEPGRVLAREASVPLADVRVRLRHRAG